MGQSGRPELWRIQQGDSVPIKMLSAMFAGFRRTDAATGCGGFECEAIGGLCGSAAASSEV